MRICIIETRSAAACIRFCGFHGDSMEKVRWRLLLLAHSLEKGLGMDQGRKNFGLQKAADLLRMIDRYLALGGDRQSYEYREAVSVLVKYRDFRMENDLDVSAYEKLDRMAEGIDLVNAGSREIFLSDVTYEAEHFEKLCNIRHSVRSFSRKTVEKREIDRAIAMMATAPSACNRQMVKIHCAMDRSTNLELGKIIPGNTGFEEAADKYLFITADMTAFDDVEIDQWYVNGGIYAAYLQLAFTACEIGSCIFQWPKDVYREKCARKLLGIPENEAIVTVLGIGHYRESFHVLMSERKPVEEFIRYVK